jgi:hypothetical protein
VSATSLSLSPLGMLDVQDIKDEQFSVFVKKVHVQHKSNHHVSLLPAPPYSTTTG